MSVKKIATLVIFPALVLVPAVPAAAQGSTINRGACMSYLAKEQNDLVKYQAPGQNGNGPLTKVNGELNIPNAFDGAMGCSR
jgi:hypothetical protein